MVHRGSPAYFNKPGLKHLVVGGWCHRHMGSRSQAHLVLVGSNPVFIIVIGTT